MFINKHNSVLHLVGIGASAGGLGALTKLLANIKPNNRTVYIIAQHMGRNNFVAPLISLLRRISILPVVEAIDNAPLGPDQIFFIPAGVNGVVQNGNIQLLPIPAAQISSPSIDVLFESIAYEYLEHGTGVILSGAGNDGLIGACNIKKRGGKIIAQTPISAQMDGMPSAVIAAKLTDYVLPPDEIGVLLNNLMSDKKTHALLEMETSVTGEFDVLQLLLRKVHAATGKDFSNYKEETLLRRIHRRMSELNLTALNDYLNYTQKYRDELTTLQHQFLISVSSFFRDNDSFLALKKELHELIARKINGDSIRIWVPGCASGEECYSLAILLVEILDDALADFDIKIIGSDLNKEAIATANTGIYRTAALSEMPANIADRYIDPHNSGYRVKPLIHRMCEFQLEDVLKTRPTEGLDVISCRNLLIYLKAPLQDVLIKSFYDCLTPQGLLFIGQSETIGLLGGTLFIPLDHFHRVYQRKKNNFYIM